MSIVTVRNIPEEIHRALKLRAAQLGRSTEAEIRDTLETAVRPENRIRMGSLLADFGRRLGGVAIKTKRDPAPMKAARFKRSFLIPMSFRSR